MRRCVLAFVTAVAMSFGASVYATTTEYGIQLPNCPASGDRVVLTANVLISGHSEGRIKFVIAPDESIVEILNGCAVSLTAIGWQNYTFVGNPHVKLQHPVGGGAYSTYAEADESVIEILN